MSAFASSERRLLLRRLTAIAMVGGLLAGCGLKGAPQPPSGEKNVYPRAYPSAEPRP